MKKCRIPLLLCIGLLCARPAYGYLDPFTGGTLFQLLFAAMAGLFAGAAIFPRQLKRIGGAVIHKLGAAFRRLVGKK